MADNGKKHMVIDLVANNSIFPRNMLHPMKCRIINVETGEQVGLVQKLELQFEVSSGSSGSYGNTMSSSPTTPAIHWTSISTNSPNTP